MQINFLANNSLTSLFPCEIIEQINDNKFDRLDTLCISEIFIKGTSEAIQIFQKRQYLKLDALVGNCGCQHHALKLLCMTQSEPLQQECNGLKDDCTKITRDIIQYKSVINSGNSKAESKLLPITQFFNEKIAAIKISEEMQYLIRSHLLTVTKNMKRTPDGFETEVTEPARLSRLSKGIKGALLQKIVAFTQVKMAQIAIEFNRREAKKIFSIEALELNVLERMLGEDNVYHYSAKDGFEKKAYAHQYFTIKTLLLRLREMQTVICLRRMARENEKMLPIFYRSVTPEGPFQRLTDDESAELDKNLPAMVIEGYIPDAMSKETFAQKLDQHGLYEVMLASISQFPQYIAGKPEWDILKDPEAAKEFALQRDEMALKYECKVGNDPFFKIEHVSCSSMKDEWEIKCKEDKHET
jgi:hypothetical protein